MTVNSDPNDLKSISPEDRKRLEEMGLAFVRRVMSMPGGLPYPLNNSASKWLAEIDDEARKHTEAHQAEQTRLNKSTLIAAWIAAGAAIVAVVVGILTWLFPLH
jgi:hypothetical protein